MENSIKSNLRMLKLIAALLLALFVATAQAQKPATQKEPVVKAAVEAVEPVAAEEPEDEAQDLSVDEWITEYFGSPLYPSQHGEPGRPGLDRNSEQFGRKWGFRERIPYPGSVEHVRVAVQRYMPVAPVYNARTLLKNWRATELPGLDKSRITEYAEPVYYVPKYPKNETRKDASGRNIAVRIDAFDTGKKNAPVQVVAWKVSDAPFNLDFGTLEAGRPYAVRVIAATPTRYLQPDVLRLVINCEINDGVGGKTNLYRKRVAAIDEFYSVVEFFFWAPEKRAYSAKLSLDPSTKLPELLVYNLDLHDKFALIAARAAKKSASLYDVEGRAAAWRSKAAAAAAALPAKNKKKANAQPAAPLTPEERAARDRQIWGEMPGLNVQMTANDPYNSWRGRFVNPRLRKGEPAPDPVAGFIEAHKITAPEPLPKDDGLGIDFYDTPEAKARGLSRQTAYLTAPSLNARSGFHTSLHRFLGTAGKLASEYHESGDARAGRDAAIYLAALAWKLPVFDSRQILDLHDITPNSTRGEDTPFRRRPRGMSYTLRGEWPHIARYYDYVFPLLQNNAELAQAVGQFVPWVKTPADLQRFYEAGLLQYRAAMMMDYNAYTDDPTPAWMAVNAAVQQDPQITKPWIDWLFKYVWTYPNPPLGVDELMANNIQRDGTRKTGSWFYAHGGNFATELTQLLSTYKKFGGTLPYDLASTRGFPKAIAMCYFPILGRVAGGYHFQVGDVGGPSEARFRSWMTESEEGLIRQGWGATRDPRFAYIIVRHLGRSLESDGEWAELQKAAEGQRHPVFENKSRVLSDWFGILESGTESDDFRFRRAAGLRVGTGYGHAHDDPLDLQIWAQGVPLAADSGQRPGYVNPQSSSLISHNTVVSRQSRGRSWISSFADAPGARYLQGRTNSNYVRQLALIDVDEGKPSAQPIDDKELVKGKLPADIVAPNSYVVDVFRVRGGDRPAYAFHGPATDELITNVANKRAAKPDENEILKAFGSHDSKWIGDVPNTLVATWRMRREKGVYKDIELQAAEQRSLGQNFDPDAPRKYMRMHLPGRSGDSVFGAIQRGKKVVNFIFENLYVQPQQWGGKNTQAVFAAVYEPYSGEPFIEEVKLLSPPSALSDFNAAIALEVILKNGRRDVVLLSPGGKTATVAGTSFNGEFGYISRDAKGVRQATLASGTKLQAEGVLLAPQRASYSGEVKSVDYAAKTATLSVPLPENSAGAVLEIGPARYRTSYTVAASSGDQTTFLRGMDEAGSRIVAMDESGGIRTVSNIAQVGRSVSGDDGVPLWRMGKRGEGRFFKLEGGPDPKTKLKVGDMLRLWEFGPGDKYTLPAWSSVIRGAGGEYSRDGNVAAEVKIGGQEK